MMLRGLLIAVCMAGLTACVTPDMGRAPDEHVDLPFLAEGGQQTWSVGNSQESSYQRLEEFVQGGETVHNWTQLLTVNAFTRLPQLPGTDAFLRAQQQDLARSCPGTSLDVVRRLADGVLYEIRFQNCASGTNEELVGRVLEGREMLFVVLYAVRGDVSMTSERRAEWLDRLAGVTLAGAAQPG